MKIMKILFFSLLSVFIFSGIGFAEEDFVTDLSDPEVENTDETNYAENTYIREYSQFSRPLAYNSVRNKKISLNLKDMEVVEALKMLASRGNMNIAFGKNVSGRVNLMLKNVDIWDAFEIILASCDLAYESKGEIVNIITQDEFEITYGKRFNDAKRFKIFKLKNAKLSDMKTSLDELKSKIGKVIIDENSNTIVVEDTPEKINDFERFINSVDLPLQTKVFNLSYAEADEIRDAIKEALTKNVGLIKVDERTNKIAITDYPDKLKQIEKIVGVFDEKSPQVLIDAQIIEVLLNSEYRNGIDWNNWLKNNLNLTVSPGNKLSVGISSDTSIDSNTLNNTITESLRKIGKVEIISSPYIAAINNQETKILMGTKEVYVSQVASEDESGLKSTADQVNFLEVGIKLCLTPTINRDGFISMKVRPEISSVKDYYKYGSPLKKIPIIETSETETNFIVKDGATVILAGLKKDTKDQFVGDKELVVILTSRIFNGESFIPEVSSKKLEEAAREIGLEYYKLITDKINFVALAKQPIDQKGQIQLSFTVSKNGKLVSNPFVVDTDNSELIYYAKKAVRDASPFPPLPKNFKKDKATFAVTINYE